MGCQTKPHFCNSERRDEKCDFHLRVIFPKNGYKSKRKVKNCRIPPMLWWRVETYCLKNFLKMCQLGPIFPKKFIVSLQGRDYGKYSFQSVLHFEEFSSSVIGVFFFFIFLIFCKKIKTLSLRKKKSKHFSKKFTK